MWGHPWNLCLDIVVEKLSEFPQNQIHLVLGRSVKMAPNVRKYFFIILQGRLESEWIELAGYTIALALMTGTQGCPDTLFLDEELN